MNWIKSPDENTAINLSQAVKIEFAADTEADITLVNGTTVTVEGPGLKTFLTTAYLSNCTITEVP